MSCVSIEIEMIKTGKRMLHFATEQEVKYDDLPAAQWS